MCHVVLQTFLFRGKNPTGQSSSHKSQLANNWTSQAAIDQSRRRAEQEAFDKLIERIDAMWMGVIQAYGPSLSVEIEG